MAAKEKVIVNNELALVYDFTEKPNKTQLKAHEDRAVVAKLRADLVLPTDKILTVDIDFDTDSGYHGNAMIIMDDFGVELLISGFESKYGKEYADKIREAWNTKQYPDDPRKPTYIMVQKPKHEGILPQVIVACGGRGHDDDDDDKGKTITNIFE
ncbi:hypothetical protein [Thalassotalea agarivorans]|uniref:Uncharacterized protein n=1 Tax=Thalassotalea agarivorans TaxID=349064 RepID=A0A1I0FEX4_THASX|nr:hypothetical protein [Thalassotalea agarivorans]SET56087.1 hypothetical protein SAMN05660429_02079 [Thalassotalea agarivorans]